MWECKLSLRSVSIFLLVFWVLCVSLSEGQHGYEEFDYQAEESNRIYLSPMDGIDCMIERMPRRKATKGLIPAPCWNEFRTLVHLPSSYVMHTMQETQFCRTMFKTISHIARQGRRKKVYKNARIRCSGYRTRRVRGRGRGRGRVRKSKNPRHRRRYRGKHRH